MESSLPKWSPKKNQWLILVLIGMLFVVIAIPTEKGPVQEDTFALNEEMRLKSVLEQVEGVGKVNVMITYRDERAGTVEGIVIIAEGGGNSVAVRNITEVVQALFDVDSHKIKVMKGN